MNGCGIDDWLEYGWRPTEHICGYDESDEAKS